MVENEEHILDLVEDFSKSFSKGGCKVIPTKVGKATSKLIKKGEELDAFVKYILSNPIGISENVLQSLTYRDLIKTTQDGNIIGFTDNYIKIKEFILGYANSRDFMHFFGLLYGLGDYSKLSIDDIKKMSEGDRDMMKNDIRNFENTKLKIKQSTFEFFNIIEGEKTTLTTKERYLNKLLGLVKGYGDSNDVTVFITIEPRGKDILRNRKDMEDYFGIKFDKVSTFNRIFGTEGKKVRLGQDLTYSLYEELPEAVKEFYDKNQLLLQDSIGNHTKGSLVTITKDTFKKLKSSDQLTLFNAALDAYTKGVYNSDLYYDKIISIEEAVGDKPMFEQGWTDRENGKKEQYEPFDLTEYNLIKEDLEVNLARLTSEKRKLQSLKETEEYELAVKIDRQKLDLLQKQFVKIESYFVGYKAADRYITATQRTDFGSYTDIDKQIRVAKRNAEMLAGESANKLKHFFAFHLNKGRFSQGINKAMKMLTNGRVYSLLLVLSNGREGAQALVTLNSLQFLSWFGARQYARFGLDGDLYKFVADFKLADPKLARLYTNGLTTEGLKGIYDATLTIGGKILEANFFNIADVMNDVVASVGYVKKYINSKFPRMTHIDEYYNYLASLSKDARKEEREALIVYIDREKNLMHNLSFDQSRNTNYGVYRGWAQPVATILSRLHGFFREYMKASWNHYLTIIREGWKSPSSAMVMDWMEQYWNGTLTRKELDAKLLDAFTKNEDFARLGLSLLMSVFYAKSIVKADIHNNSMEENDIEADILDMFVDFIRDFWFPAAAFERTDLGMFLRAAIDTASFEYTPTEFSIVEGTELAKTELKQLAKGLYILRWIASLSGKYSSMFSDEDYLEFGANPKGFIEKHRDLIVSSLKDTIGSFGYFLQQDLVDTGYTQKVPRTHSSLLSLYQGQWDFSKKLVVEAERIARYKYLTKDIKNYWNGLLYNLPFIGEYKRGAINTEGDDIFGAALEEMNGNKTYRTMAVDGRYPDEGVSDEVYLFAYNMGTRHLVGDNNLDGLTIDLSFVGDDGTLVEDRRENIKEQIFTDLLKDKLSLPEYKAALKAIDSAEKSYQIDALRTLLFSENNVPGSGAQILGYLMNQKMIGEVFGGKYGYFKRDENGKIIDQARLSIAMQRESIAAAKEYSEYFSTVDRQVWGQIILRQMFNEDLQISKFLTDPGDSEKKSIGFNQIGKEGLTNSQRKELYEITLYTDMQAGQGDPNAYAYNNFLLNTFSTAKSYTKDPEVMMRTWNYLFDRIGNYGVSDIEKVIEQSVVISQNDRSMATFVRDQPIEVVRNHEGIQLGLRNLYGTLELINDLGMRAAGEYVNKHRDGLDPTDISFSFITNMNGKKNWKYYYNKNKYFFDKLRRMGQRYQKYYNKFYPYKERNATPRYTQQEREFKRFGQTLRIASGVTSRKSKKTRKNNVDNSKPGGSLTQRRGKARAFTNWGDLDKIPDRKTKPRNRRTRGYAIGSKLWNRLIPGRRRYIKTQRGSVPTVS